MAQEGIIRCTINLKAQPFIKWNLTPSPNPEIWFDSGVNIKVPYGTYYLQTSPTIYGWTIIKKEDPIIINSDKEILININIVEHGNLRIKLKPNEIKELGRWRPINTNVWYMDNEEISLFPNTYEIEFKDIENYAKIVNQFYCVIAAEVHVYYITPYLHLGSIQIVFKENVTLESIGKPLWRIKNTSVWNKSGETLFLPADTYTIEFNTVGIFTHKDYIIILDNENTISKEIEFVGVNLFIIPTKSSINFYNFQNFQKLNIFSNLLSFKDTNQVTTNYNNTLLAIAHNDAPYLTIYNLLNYDIYYDKQLIKPLSSCRSLDFSNDGQYLAVSHNNFPYLTIYKTNDWSQIELTSLPTNYCNTVQFSNDSMYLAVGSDKDPFVNIYLVSTAEKLITLTEIVDEVFCLDFNLTNTHLVIGCSNRKIYVYDIINNILSKLFIGRDVGTVYGVKFFDEKYIIAVSSLFFYIFYYENFSGSFVSVSKIPTTSIIPNINNHILVSPDQKYIIIGCVGYPYIVIYETTNWTRVAFDGSFLDYCKKSTITGDLSLREYVNIPTNKYPMDLYKSLTKTEELMSSDFSYFSVTNTDTHVKSQWRLLDSDENIVHDSDESNYLTFYSLPDSFFDIPANYFWQVRHKGENFGWSLWSKLTSFDVVNQFIQKPVNLTPINNTIDIIENPILTSSNFVAVNITDTHIFSKFYIYKDLELKWCTGSLTCCTSYNIPKGKLDPSTEYSWCVQYKSGLLGWSDLSDKTFFTTTIWEAEKPSCTYPPHQQDGIDENEVKLGGSSFTPVNDDDTHTYSRYEIYENDNLIYSTGEIPDTRVDDLDFELPKDILSDDEHTYFWRLSYKHSESGWGPWSDKNSFTTGELKTCNVFISIYPDVKFGERTTPLGWRWKQKGTLISEYSEYIVPSYDDYGSPIYIKIPLFNQPSIQINFEDYKGISAPADIIIDNMIINESYNYNVIYKVLSGDGKIQCNITNAPINAGWRIVDDSNWRDSGYTETDLSYDVYQIEFKDVVGYINPLNHLTQIIVKNSNLIIKTAQYEIDDALIYYVVVNIDRGGQWKLNSDSVWYNTGERVSLFGISVDSIVFSDVPGYITPNDITFQIPNTYDNDTTIHHPDPNFPKTLLYTRKYTLDNIGQLRCNLLPGYAKWKLSTATILNNTTTILDLVAGTYVINFENIGGYKHIIDETNIIVVANEITTISKNYILEPSIGDLEIELNPLTARFKVKDVDKWYDSNNIYPMLIGTYIIEFETVENYTTPVNKSVTINKDELTKLIVKYVPSIESKYIKLIVEGIDYKTNKVQYRTRYSLTKDLWSSWTDRIQYYTVDGLNDIISDLKLGFYEINFNQFTYFQFMSHKIVEFKGEDIISTFTYVGSTGGGYGSIGVYVNLIDSNSNPVQDTSILTNLLEYQHTEISDDIYNNKDASKIIWSDNWVKTTDINSIITSLSKTTKHAYKIKPVNGYFNLGDTGNISYVSLDIHTSITLSFIKYEFTNIYFGLPYLSNINDAKSGFITPEIPDVTSFNINFRTKNEFEDKFDGNLKTILINGHIETYTIYGLTYQILKSDNITLTDLFGCNQLGYLSVVNFTVDQTGTTTTSIPYNPKTLIALNGFNLSALLSVNIPKIPPTQSSYASVYQSPLTLNYCSDIPTEGIYGKYPCINNYFHEINYTGFKNQVNPNDPIRIHPITFGLNLAGSSLPGNLFRYYLPKGTTGCELTLYGPPPDGECATLSRLGSPPISKFPTNYNQFRDLEKYPDIFPPSLYPDIRTFWNGKNPQQLKQNDWFAINQGGHITILCNGLQLTEGDWLYVYFNNYEGSSITIHSYVWYCDENIYTEWYNNYTGSWLANGDPPEYF